MTRRQLTYAIVGDGGTDRVLIPVIEWLIHRLDPTVEVLEPEFRKRQGSVETFLNDFHTGAMVVFVHRDAEGEHPAERHREFLQAAH